MEDKVVRATLVDECTLEFMGVRFVREGSDEEEVLLQPVTKAVAPRLRCSGCGFERQYTFWYRRLDFLERTVGFCPGCGHRILGVVGHG